MLEAILQHPDFYEGPELVTPPVVYNAGLLRSIGRPTDTTAWAWLSNGAGQQLFYPPNVSDFRAMYCSLLEQWFETEAGLAIPEAASFERPVLIES